MGIISSTNTNGDPCDSYYNILLDPRLTDESLSLVPGSPCIDAGDPARPLDGDNTIADMGAIYFHQPPGGYDILSGNLSGSLDAGFYYVTSDIGVASLESLILEPGTDLVFTGSYKFQIAGHLEALGNETDSIRFIKFEGIGGWCGIKFLGADDESTLDYCLVSGSDSSGITMTNCSPTISHCLIAGNMGTKQGTLAKSTGGGIRLIGSNAGISYCTIADNEAGLGWAGNIYRGGGISCEDYSEPLIEYCIIIGNYSQGSIHSCGAGISCENYSNPTIIHCNILDNVADSYGGALSCFEESFPLVVNSIVADNEGDGAMYFQDYTSDCTINFNDFCNNGEDDFSGYPAAGLGYLHGTNINGDSVDYHDNIFLDPMFVDAVNGDFNLQEESPCIDAGDPESPLDLDSTIADMGVFYFHQASGVRSREGIQFPQEYRLCAPTPNPFNPSTTINYDLRAAGAISLVIYDVNGRLVECLVCGYQSAGAHQVVFKGSNLASGIYFVRLQAGDFLGTQKLLLLK